MNPARPDAIPDPRVLRLIDANANRAREALRVLEDYVRFTLDDAPLSFGIKQLRHGLSNAISLAQWDAVLHRDASADVGAANKTESEAARTGVVDVVTAAGKRLGEALRSLEEYLKTVDPAAATAVERLRYLAYDIERDVARTLRGRDRRMADVRLYVIVTESLCRRPWLDAAEQALVGGADCIQLREKSLEGGELMIRARALVALCRRFGVPCIINDRPDIAVLVGADGVHVGQGDLSVIDARKIVGDRLLVGVSTHTLDQAKRAVLNGADYIGVGPFFRSSTKPRDFVAGPAIAKEVAAKIAIPAIAIAGITSENVAEVKATGIRAIAVTSAVLCTDDVAGATQRLKSLL